MDCPPEPLELGGAAAKSPQGFIVSVTKGRACRRLHFAGGCFRIAGEHYKNFRDYGQALPDAHLFDFRCRDCFPADKVTEQAEEAQAEMSESDGSCSSVSSDSAADSDGDALVSPPEP